MGKVTKSDCSGCYNDHYNHVGNSTTGQCWSLDSATMVKGLDIPIDMPPPYKHMKETLRPSCYERQREVRVKKESLTKEGYWK